MSAPERVTLIASLTESPDEDGDELRRVPSEVGWLEVRSDLVGDLDPDWLRERFAGKLLYTLRSRSEGGRFEGSASSRLRRLRWAAERYDFVDLEAERDRSPKLLAELPKARRILSWHGNAISARGLRRRLEAAEEVGAGLYKLVPNAAQEGDELAPISLLQELGRSDVVAFATGEIGLWTRLVAPRLGASVVFGACGGRPAAPGQLAIARLLQDFGMPELRPVSRFYGIVGCPVGHSLSPRLHNGAYRALGLDAFYLPFDTPSFGDFWLEVVEGGRFPAALAPLAGLSVTAPFKAAALAIAGAASPLAHSIESANTMVFHDGVWEAESTDPEGVVGPLRAHGVELADREALVIGCGGAGRAAAAGLLRSGCRLTVSNRGAERGREVAASFGARFVSPEQLSAEAFAVVVHATPLGHKESDPLPLDVDRLAPGAALVDLVYRERPTPLVEAVRRRGGLAVDGREVLLYQAVKQFRLMTGHELPLRLGRELLGLEGGEGAA